MSSIGARLQNRNLQATPAEEPSHQSAWGSLAPDAPDLQSGGPVTSLAVANNVLPREDNSYGPFLGPTILGNALDQIVKGAISVTDNNGVAWTFAGDGSRSNVGDLYESSDYQYSKVSKGPGSYAIQDEEFWDATQFDQRVIMTTINEPVQSKTIGQSANFADLITGTNKPQARYCATIGNFVMLGNISDATDGLRPNRVWWSGFNDPTTFDPSTTTQSDFEDLPEGGQVQGIVGGQEYGVILQTNHIRRVTYRGDAAIFDFDPIDRTRGTPIPRSIAARGRLLAYISEEGPMMFDGLNSTEIGHGQINRNFWSEFDPNDRNSVSAAIDPVRNLIIWAYPANGGTNRLPNKLLVYNYESKRWSTVDIECDMIFTAFFLGINVDTADSRLDNIDTSVWADRSIDSIIFKGGFLGLTMFDLAHQQNAFDGPALQMRMESKDLSLFTGQAASVWQARPLVEGDVKAFIGKRDVQGGAITYLPEKDKGRNGLCHFADQATTGRYHRFCLAAAKGATWNKASGYQLYARPTGAFSGN